MSVRKEPAKTIAQKEQGLDRSAPSSLTRKLRGKHHDLKKQVLKELVELSTESAPKVPLANYSAKDLRSAVSRAASSQKIKISSTSDGENLYVWRRF